MLPFCTLCVVIFLSYSNQILMLRESKMPTAEEILLACARGCYKKIFQQVFLEIFPCAFGSGENSQRTNRPLMASFIRTRYLCYFSTSFTKGNMVMCIFLFLNAIGMV